jgi:hypothetical protein
MTERVEAKPVKLIHAEGELDCVVENPDEKPWSVVAVSAAARQPSSEPWQVIVLMESVSASDGTPIPLVFTNREVASDWLAEHGFADRFSWLRDGPDLEEAIDLPAEFAKRFLAIAAAHNVSPDSPEAIEHARNDEEFSQRFKTLVCYRYRGWGGTENEPPYPVPQGQLVRLPWPPLSLRHTGSSDLYDANGDLLLSLRAPVDIDDLPFDAVYAYSDT